MPFFREYTLFWQRLFAGLLDLIWLSSLVFSLIYIVENQQTLTFELISMDGQFFLLTEILPALLILLFWLIYGATPGKLLFDSKIVDATTGHNITFKQAFLRYLGYILIIFSLGLGFLWMLFDKRKQGWHDKIANTIVILHDESQVSLTQLEQESS